MRNIGVRSRGTGSRSGVKPGLRFDFDRYTTDQKFLGLKSFILRNNTQDPSGMRERLSMELFKRMGLIAEREAHARFYINNTYVGLFTIVESLDKTFLTKNFNENDGHLYEYSFDNTDPAPFNFGYPGSDPALYTPAPFKPETLELDPQGEVFERLFWTANVASDAVWRTSIEEFLDMKKFIRHLAIENFLAEEDGLTGDYGPNNFYFYRFVNKNLLHVPAVGQEQHVLGEPVVLHPPQHRGRHREQAQPAGAPRAEGAGSARAVVEHAPGVRRLDHAAGGGDRGHAVAAVGGDADLESDPRRELCRSVARGLHQRGLGRVDPVPDHLGADPQRHRARAGRGRQGEARRPVVAVSDRSGRAARPRSARGAAVAIRVRRQRSAPR